MFVLIIDALTPTVVDSGRLSFIQPLLENGFRAEIEPCVDRLTVPCLRDAFTGTSSFGLFGAFDNLVAARGLGPGHLFSDLRQFGRTTGVVAPGEFDQFASWLDVYHRDKRGQPEAVIALLDDAVDLVIYHYVWLDLVTHRAPFEAPAYQNALATLDRQVRGILEHLPEDYDFVVMGDHGHDAMGRHIQGLDVPTVFLAPATVWPQRSLTKKIPISTYRFLLGAMLGVLPPPQYEGDNLAELLAEDSSLRPVAAELSFRSGQGETGFPFLPLLVSLMLPAILLRIAPADWRETVGRQALLFGAFIVAFASGAYYPTLVATLHFNPAEPNYTSWLPRVVLALSLVGLVLRPARYLAAGCLALFWVAYAQTLYPYGFYARVMPLALVTTLGCVLLLEPGFRRRDYGSLAKDLMVLLALIGIVRVLQPVYVLNFAIDNFYGLRAVPQWLYLGFPALWGVLVALASKTTGSDWRSALSRLGWGVTGTTAAAIAIFVDYPAWLTALLVLVSALALFTKRVAVAILLAALLLPQLLGLVPAYGVALALAFAWLVLSTSARKKEGARWIEAGLLAALAYYATAYSSGLRANGLDYQFALEWFPGRLAETLWFLVGGALLIKVLLPAALIFLLLRAFGRQDLRGPIQFLIGARIAASAIFTLGFISTVDQLPRYRLLEICEDMIVWWLLLAVVSLIPLGTSEPEVELKQNRSPASAG